MSRNVYIKIFLTFIFTFFFLPSEYTTKAQPAKNADESSQIKISADRLIYDDKTMQARLINNVKIVNEDVTVTAKNALFNGKTKTAYLTGGVKIVKEGSTLTGDKMDVFYNEKKAFVYENVRAITYQGSDKKSKDEPTILTCKKADFFWENNDVFARQNVKITKGDKRAFADEGHYSQELQTINLTGNVRFEQGPKNWMSAPQAIFDLKAETFLAKGGVEAEIEVEKEKKQKEPIKNERIISPQVLPEQEDIMIQSDQEE